MAQKANPDVAKNPSPWGEHPPLWPDPWLPLTAEAQIAQQRAEARLLVQTARKLEQRGEYALARALYLHAHTLLEEMEDFNDLYRESTAALHRLQKVSPTSSLAHLSLSRLPLQVFALGLVMLLLLLGVLFLTK